MSFRHQASTGPGKLSCLAITMEHLDLMKINGIPRLACYTKVSELKGNTITCGLSHIRDLVRDL
jgi:hypothetical protein